MSQAGTDADRGINPELGRRELMRSAAVGGVALAAAGSGWTVGVSRAWPRPDKWIADNAWRTGEYILQKEAEFLGIDFDGSGVSVEALTRSIVEQVHHWRNSDEAILESLWNTVELISTNAWFEAQVAVIEQINAGADEQTVVQAGMDAVDEAYTAPQNNVYNHYAQQVQKVQLAYDELNAHQSIGDPSEHLGWEWNRVGDSGEEFSGITGFGTEQRTLLDGSTMEVPTIDVTLTVGSDSYDQTIKIDGMSGGLNFGGSHNAVNNLKMRFDAPSDAGTHSQRWSHYQWDDPWSWADLQNATSDNPDSRWGSPWFDTSNEWGFSDLPLIHQYMVLLDRIEQDASMVRSNVETYATNAYNDIQAGEYDAEDLAQNSPGALATAAASDYETTGHYAYAGAYLGALGASWDLENQMVFELDDGTTFEGTLYNTDSSFEFTVGEQIDPAEEDGVIYAAYDRQTVLHPHADEDYRENVDGGEAMIYVQPVEGMNYRITTTHGEQVDVPFDAWQHDADVAMEATEWYVDLTDGLDQPITSIAQMESYYQEGYDGALLQIQQPFTITEARDVETGEEVDTVSGEGLDLYESDTGLTDEELEIFREWYEEQGTHESSDLSGGAGWPDLGLGGLGIPSLGAIAVFVLGWAFLRGRGG